MRFITSISATTVLLNLIKVSNAFALAPKQHVIKRKIGLVRFITEPEFIAKYIIMIFIGVVAFSLLKSKKMNKKLKVSVLLVSLILFGFMGNFFSWAGLQPSPVCAAVKPFLLGLKPPFLIFLSVIFALTLLGPKLFCGWVCPVGAFQELISMISDRLGIKRWNFSFRLSNSIRAGILVAFFLLSVTAVLHTGTGEKTVPESLYGYFNAFYGMNIDSQKDFTEYIINYLPLILTVILAVILYRPYCHFICPIGLYTNILEHIAVFRVSLDEKKCNSCNLCVKRSPCKALPCILKGSRFRADCFICNRCLEECGKEAFTVAAGDYFSNGCPGE